MAGVFKRYISTASSRLLLEISTWSLLCASQILLLWLHYSPKSKEQRFSSSSQVPLLQVSPEQGSPSPGTLPQAVLHQLLKQLSHLSSR